MSIQSDIQSLAPGTLVELFEIDLNPIGVAEQYFFHNGVNALGSNVVWNGVTYTRFPVQAEGFELRGQGSQPRPTLTVANITGLLSASVRAHDDLVRAKVIRRRTFLKYLDAVNFPGGVNATADPLMALNDEVWFVDRKVSENRVAIEWELVPAFDLTNVYLPGMQVIQNVCQWRYRSAECSYTGGAVANASDTPTTVLAQDVCGKRLSSCILRFGNGALPFGGFPGARLIG